MPEDLESLEEDEYVYRKKGSARRLSMKEKAKKRVLRKL
jgi:hypothetical protein